ncbi:cadmium-translocating P-type ATPase (plasmid) [Deinococcus sp. KNUC1210]|uniref:heavy metal translocating P-type ATPase n=1 Tax=Deinococcus sp. KNUC1210 TaxID=2917691 RepID=UPI001EEFB783|nr:heavy metal translocating P-type ATPase [Deinococcus sp. KNUC1210]ULH13905.1 cadmium-translocating P-type ATPase [Deinococcus sp. KNUC1210]
MATTAKHLDYFVEGMDCASCVQKVERMVTGLPGTAEVRTSFAKQTLQLTLDESQTSRETLERGLKSLGYAASPVMALQTAAPSAGLSYFVENMDCASCVQKVERMVTGLPGTAEVRTSFAKQTLQLTLDESQTSRETLEHSLRSMGYGPSPLTDTLPTEAADTQKESSHGHTVDRTKPWYATAQGKLVVGSGALLALAFVFGFIEPRLVVYGYVAATLLGTWPLLKKAVASARFGDPFSINMLVSTAALGAVLIGQAAEGAVVVFFFAVGELLEGVAAGRARAGIQALAALAPKTALLVTGTQIREVPADQLRVGQTVQVQPGARVPADGRIVSGTSSLDDSPVTGESVPVEKTVGDSVYAGSINGLSVLNVKVVTAAADNTIARIIHMVEEAEGSKAQTARFIDRFSRWYTPGVVAVAALVAILPPLLLGGVWHEWLYKGIALLLIGCPCALVLSVPAAITSGVSAGARRGLLIKGGAALENIGNVRTVAFDKTGTLTAGHPRVTDVLGLGLGENEVLRLAAAVESGSTHPLAQAIRSEALSRNLSLPPISKAQAIPGRAVSADVEGRALSVASPRHAASVTVLDAGLQAQIDAFEEQGRTTVLLLEGKVPLGVLALRDEARPDARAAIAALKDMGIRALMLTGDNTRTGKAIAADLGLDVQAELLPEDKLKIIGELKSAGGVAMVGDGINDAPALAASDVGIAMGGGTDVALETADAALLREQVSGIPDLIALSRATMQNIRLNIAFALGLKAIFLMTTLLGYTNLWMAVLADTGATAIVTANALRLLSWKPRRSEPLQKTQGVRAVQQA